MPAPVEEDVSGGADGDGRRNGDGRRDDEGLSDGSRWRPGAITVVVLVLGLLVTGTLAAVTAIVNNSNENHLLQEQVREAGTVLTGALPDIETPLASGAAIAGVTDGQRARLSTSYRPTSERKGPLSTPRCAEPRMVPRSSFRLPEFPAQMRPPVG